MDNKVIGINEPALEHLVLEIDNYIDRIQRVFNDLEDLYSDVSKFVSFNEKGILIDSMQSLTYNSKMIQSNLLSYKADLMKVKSKYKNTTRSVVDMIKKANSRIEDINKYIERS